ncbi:MAG: hypothetical protein U0835_17885 [Isosphaeraceae bacterium]
MRPRLALSLTALSLALGLGLTCLPGCDDPGQTAGQAKSKGKGKGKTKPKADPAQDEDPYIVGRRTQDVRRADVEVQQNGAVVATQKITAKDPITLQGNAYVTAIGKLSILSIQQAMDLYRATNDRYPKDYDEFMNEIIKANNIALPKLPFYQKYGNDEKEHKLVVLEYPELKAGPLPGQPR